MSRLLKSFFLAIMLLSQSAKAEHMIVTGGPALRAWEDYRVVDDRHDRWWANFIRAATLHMDNIRKNDGGDSKLVWMVYKPGYISRGLEDGKPYTTWIAEQAQKRRATLIWFSSTEDYISKINSRPKRSIITYNYFGHSNKSAFLFDYGSEIMAASVAWLHERDLPKLKSSVFAKGATCKSWGCHTGLSMSKTWKKYLRTPLIGAKGKTLYTQVGQGVMPTGFGGWTQ